MFSWVLFTSAAFAQTEACLPVALPAAINTARRAVQYERPADAILPVEVAAEGLGCLQGLVERPESLSALFQAGAAAAFTLNDVDQARAWYGDAIRMAESVSFDPTLFFEEEQILAAEALFNEVRAEVKSGPRGTVSAQSEVRLDGWQLLAGQTHSGPVGLHVVQYLDAEGKLVTKQVEISADVVLPVGPPPPLPETSPLEDTEPERHGLQRALVGGGLLLVAGGTAALWYGDAESYWAGRFDEATGLNAAGEALRETHTQNAAIGRIGGTVAIGLGAGALLGSTFIPTTNTPASGLTWAGRW